MSSLPPQQRRKLIEFANEVDLKNKHTLLECYKSRLEYGCKYPVDTERKLDALHVLCMKKLNLPWWIDLLD